MEIPLRWILLAIGIAVAIGIFFLPQGIADDVAPLNINVVVTDRVTGTAVAAAEVRFTNLQFGVVNSIARTDSRGHVETRVDLLWADNMSFASSVFPKYPDVKIEIAKQGYQSYQQTFRLRNLPPEGDGWRLDLRDVALQPLAEPNRN